MNLMNHRTLFASLFVAVMLFTGCKTTQNMATRVGLGNHNRVPSNFYLDEAKIANIQRVVMMPVHAPNAGLTSEAEIDQQFLSKLTETQLFEVVYISREDLTRRFGQRSFSSASVLQNTLFEYIYEFSSADAVVFFDLTTYHPFQPIQVGIRGKMITLQDQEIVWAVDEIYDACTKSVSKEAIQYEKKHLTQFEPSKQYDSILMSPTRFMAYSAEKCILTLPENSLTQKF